MLEPITTSLDATADHGTNAEARFLNQIEHRFAAIDWDRLAAAGFEKRGDYCFIYSYPPVRTLKSISADDIFCRSEWEPPQDELNMYIHIPYCTGICSYCYFAKVIDNPAAPISKERYVELLIWEIADKVKRYRPTAQIQTIHFGGGTPSTLSPDQIRRVMAFLYSLNLSPRVEVTFECAPETIYNDLEKLIVMRESGVNRINVGVESLDDKVLKMMGRRHTSEMTFRSIQNVRDAGFDNINVDLIYGLPVETLASWVETLQELVALRLESISVYRLRRHPKKAISKMEATLFPSYEDTLRMQLAHSVVLQDAGYLRVQSHKYALQKEKMQRQTERKRGVEHTQLLSAGCGAYGFLNGTFYWNTKSLTEYGERTRRGEHAVWIGRILEKDELMRKSFVLGVHTSGGINLRAFRRKFGVDGREVFNAQLAEATELGLFAVDAESARPTELGYFFGDELSVKFYSPRVREELDGLGMKYGMFFEHDRYA